MSGRMNMAMRFCASLNFRFTMKLLEDPERTGAAVFDECNVWVDNKGTASMVTLSPTDRVIQMFQRLREERTTNKLVEENQHQKLKNSLTGRVERKKLLAQQARHTILWQF